MMIKISLMTNGIDFVSNYNANYLSRDNVFSSTCQLQQRRLHQESGKEDKYIGYLRWGGRCSIKKAKVFQESNFTALTV